MKNKTVEIKYEKFLQLKSLMERKGYKSLDKFIEHIIDEESTFEDEEYAEMNEMDRYIEDYNNFISKRNENVLIEEEKVEELVEEKNEELIEEKVEEE